MYYHRFYSEKDAKEFADLVKKQGGIRTQILNEYDGYGQPIYTVEVTIEEDI